MKCAALLVTVALVVGLASTIPITKDVTELRSVGENRADAEVEDANEFVDAVLKNLRDNAIASGLDPMKLPDATYEYQFWYFFVLYHGTVTYTSGWLQNLSTIVRFGDAAVSQVGNTLEIRTNVTFSQLFMSYHYKSEVMGLGPEGEVISTIDDMIMYWDLVVDLDTCEALLKSLKITDAGKLDITLEGTWFYDEIWNAMIDWMIFLFRDVILDLIETSFRDLITEALPGMDFGAVTGIPCGPAVPRAAVRAH